MCVKVLVFLSTGADLLRLSREDLIEICGLADGIRLNNALRAKYVYTSYNVYLQRGERSHIRNRWHMYACIVCINTFIHLFIQAISIAPLRVHYYSEAFPTLQHGYCVGVSSRSGYCPRSPMAARAESNPRLFGR